ncbi:MAG TPA: di-heme-cytochrome C peroxidase [Aliidongia sp.]|nr:di-heme-cytochrome C peroxidase [Aliidongia sp.]
MNTKLFRRTGFLAGSAALTLAISACAPTGGGSEPHLQVDQGPNWTAQTRSDFYTRYQGSQIMPLAWMKALKQPGGAPFLSDSLSRYGYLPNDDINAGGLPVGFTTGDGMIGMSCAACHTRQITVAGAPYRIDGGPAITDFQSFLADLDTSVGTVLVDPAAFDAFAQSVLGGTPSPGDKAKLRQEVSDWYLRYDTLIKRALPSPAWGPARLDAVAMIFNRLTGLDLGPAPSYLIADNIRPAVAPVRYPFLWNAPVQDMTQWPGFAGNGNDILGLSRNLGEVYGVFAMFHPTKSASSPFGIDYTGINSADFKGLGALETLIKQLGPPKWPWALDQALVAQGKTVFERGADAGGCADCHGIRAGITRFFEQQTWETRILDVGTDSREYDILAWTAQSGVLDGAKIPLITDPLKPTDKSFSILSTAVIGSILQHYLPFTAAEQQAQARAGEAAPNALSITPETADLKDAFRQSVPAASTGFAYESRVLQGIWAAAPYLHNGSVPSLAELLKPAAQRTAAFQVGPAYDTVNVGLAANQTAFGYTLKTTGCDDRNSGNSRCGHEYGTSLSPEDKRALLEYLKAL